MEANNLPSPAQPVRPAPSMQASNALDSTTASMPVSSYSGGSKTYPIETLEVHQEGQARPVVSYGPTSQSIPFSRRKATIVSLVITLLIILITGAITSFFVRRSSDAPTSQIDVPTQDASLEGAIESDLPSELQGLENSLLVNGDVVTRGRLRVVSGAFTNTIGTAALTGNQTITLPNASGQVCLDINNCNFATLAQLTQIQPVAGVTTLNDLAGVVAVQGSLNQITVTTGDGIITLSTPQNLDANANVQFGSLTLNGLGPTSGVLVGTGTSAITSVAAAGAGLCLVSTAGAPAFQACPGGGGAVTSLNSLTGALTLQGTANQINVAAGGSTITLSTPQDIATTSNVTFNNLQLTGTADVDGVVSIGNAGATPDADGKTALLISHSVLTDCAFGCFGVNASIEFDAPGNPFFLTAFSGNISIGDGRSLANSTGLFINDPQLGAGASVQQNIGIAVDPQVSGNSNIGIAVGEATGTKQINLLLGVSPDFNWSNVPSGSYSIYNASTDNNYFVGNLGIGDTSPLYALTVGNGDLFGVNSSGNVIVTALGAASTDTVVCRNGSNQLATCNSTFATGSGAAFLQGGNNFGGATAGTLGTTNNGDLNVITNNLTRMTLQADGDIAFDTNTLFVNAAIDVVTVGDITGSTGIELDPIDADFEDMPSLTFGPNSNKPWIFVVGGAGNDFDVFGEGNRIATFGLGGNFWVCCNEDAQDPRLAAANAVSTPGFTFSNDIDTGMYWVNTDQLGFSTGGTNRLTLSSTGGAFANNLAVNGGSITSTAATLNIDAASVIALQDTTTLPNGLVGTPALSFASDTNTGFYGVAADQLGISTGGANRITVGVDPGAAAFATGVLRITTIDSPATGDFEIFGEGSEDLDIGSNSGMSLNINQVNSGGTFSIFSGSDELLNINSGGDITTRSSTVTFIRGYLRLGFSNFTPAGTEELIPDSSLVEVTCSNGGGCTPTLDEDFSSRGQTLRIVNVGANTVTINNTAGSVELAGSAAWVGTQWSSLTLVYVEDDGVGGRWVELARSVH